MYLIEVSVPVPLDTSFTYRSEVLPALGARVQVPFGKRRFIGINLGEAKSEPPPGIAIREVEKILDEVSLISPSLMKLARWMADYYIRPLGEVYKTMFPVSLRKRPPFAAHRPSAFPKDTWPRPLSLNSGQKEAFQTITPFLQRGETASRAKPFLLHGVTGSGKTRIYIELIRELAESSQALVLVPEIALTPQMTTVFEESFPRAVAVIHSAMTDKQRWQQWDEVFSGRAKVLIGPRSAVFVPFHKLALIVVDEEHDSSYKQSSGLCYHGRDIAVMRAHLENASCVLGSATPSIESYKNALDGKYRLITLTERASGQNLPQIEFLSAPKGLSREALAENSSQKAQFLSPELIESIEENASQGGQSIVLVNRRGYAYFVYNFSKGGAIDCPNCSISLTVHDNKENLACHYCGYKSSLAAVVGDNPESALVAVGTGSQKATQILRKRCPRLNIARIDSDVLAKRKEFIELLTKFRQRELDVMVGTQVLAKGHDFPEVSLVVIGEIDGMLGLPDFRSAERAFQLIVQAAGRAGRAKRLGKVILQSSNPELPAIRYALKHDYPKFAEAELELRKAFRFPPYGHLVRLEWSSTNLAKLEDFCIELANWTARYFAQHRSTYASLRVLGPAPPPIELINRRHRRVLMLNAAEKRIAHTFARACLSSTAKLMPSSLRILVDVDPVSLL